MITMPFHADDTVPAVHTYQLAHALTGIEFPAQRWELLAWAEHNGASHDLVQALHRLPPARYDNGSALANALIAAGVGVRAPDVVPLHPVSREAWWPGLTPAHELAS